MAGLKEFFGKLRAVTRGEESHIRLRLTGDGWMHPHPAEREMLVKLDRARDFFRQCLVLPAFLVLPDER